MRDWMLLTGLAVAGLAVAVACARAARWQRDLHASERRLRLLAAGSRRELAARTARLRTVVAALEAADEFSADLAAMVSDDLCRPLSALIGYAEMLAEDWDATAEDRRRAYAARIHAAARSLHGLTDEIRTLAQLGTGTVQARPLPVAVDQAVADAIADLVAADPAAAGDLSIVRNDACWALVDRGHLRQILARLLGNARGHGLPPVLVSVVRAAGAVELRVSDRGPGVPPELLRRMFDRPAGGQAARSGLYVVHRLAEANGATVHYQPGRGASFVVRLRPSADPTSAGPAVPVRTRRGTVPDQRSHGPG
jgi:signal transduction histidine kinase